MSLNRFHLVLIAGWCSMLSVVLAVRYAAGLSPTTWQVGAAFLLAVLPAIVLLMVFRGAPGRSIGGVLYDAERATNPMRSRFTGAKRDQAPGRARP